MARRVYLHIGTMKSATSYLQELCALNADHLAAAGMLWPAGDLRSEAVKDLFDWRAVDADFTGAWGRLARAMRRHDGDVLISYELLAGVSGAHVRRLVKAAKAEVHVVLTARDTGRLIPSHWQTTIKNGQTHTWSQFAAAICAESDDADAQRLHTWFWKRHDLMSIISRWQHSVPVGRMVLVTVPPAGGDQEEVAQRFGDAIGVELRGRCQPKPWTNSSLGAHSVELMRRLNDQIVDVDDLAGSRGWRRALGQALAEHGDKEPGFALSAAQHDWARRRALAANVELEKLGIRVEGHLDDLIPADCPPPPAVADPVETSESELLLAAERALVSMATTVAELTSTGKEADAELRSAQQEKAKAEQAAARLRRRVQRLEAQAQARAEEGGVRRSPTSRAVGRLRAAGTRLRGSR